MNHSQENQTPLLVSRDPFDEPVKKNIVVLAEAASDIGTMDEPHPGTILIKSAWLIMWHGTNDVDLTSLGRPRIVAILDYRLSEMTISRYLKLLYYSDRNLAPSWKHEMHLQSARRRNTIGLEPVASSCGVLSFGSISPWLEAKRVSGLFIIIHSDNFETTYWIEKSCGGELINFKLETNCSNSVFVEKLFHGENAVPPII